jgi:hypothetical protein
MMEGVNSSMIYLLYFKKFCGCHNVPPLSKITTTKRLLEKYCKESIANSNY